MEFKTNQLKITGIFFIIFGIISILNTIYRDNLAGILWFCYAGLIIIGIGIFKRNYYLIESQINILLIPTLFWVFDFFYFIFLEESIFGLTTYFFDPNFPLISKIISLQHLFTIPISLYVISKLKTKKSSSWRLSFIQIAIFYLIIYFFTSPEKNINCVFRSCIPLAFPLPYLLVFFTISFFIVFLTNEIINRFAK